MRAVRTWPLAWMALAALALRAAAAFADEPAKPRPRKSAPACAASPEVLARELLELQLSGMFLHSGSPCLDPSRFKHVIARPEPMPERDHPDRILDDTKDKIAVTEVTRYGDSGARQYAAIVRGKTAEGKEIRDAFVFVVNKGAKRRALDGCAAFLVPTASNMVWARCR